MTTIRRTRTGTTYGQRGGEGANKLKKLTKFAVTLPDGRVVIKGSYNAEGRQELVATAYTSNTGRVKVGLWLDSKPSWEGEFGRLVAKVVS
jgi:hypothetical protein